MNSVARKLSMLPNDGDFVVKNVPTNIDISVNQKQANGYCVDIVAKPSGLQSGDLSFSKDSVVTNILSFSKNKMLFGKRVQFAGLFSFVNPARSNTETGRLAQENAEANLNLYRPQKDNHKTVSPNIKLIGLLDIPKGPKSGDCLCLRKTIISVKNVVTEVSIYRHIILNHLRIFLNCDTRYQMGKPCAVNATIRQKCRPSECENFMGKKQPNTPRSKIRAALRQLWMRSRERAAALKVTGYRCEECGIKQSAAKGKEVKLQVHHEPKINWNGLIDLIVERLLEAPQFPLCKNCHEKVHKKLP